MLDVPQDGMKPSVGITSKSGCAPTKSRAKPVRTTWSPGGGGGNAETGSVNPPDAKSASAVAMQRSLPAGSCYLSCMWVSLVSCQPASI